VPDAATTWSEWNGYEFEGGVTVRPGTGDGGFGSIIWSIHDGGIPLSLAVGDLNEDEIHDLVVAWGEHYAGNLFVFLGLGDGTFGDRVAYTALNPLAVAISDLNDDRLPDLAIANALYDDLEVFVGVGGGSFASTIAYGTATSWSTDLAVADLNGDQLPDLLVAGSRLTVLLGYASGPASADPSESADRPRLFVASNRPNPFRQSTEIVFVVPAPGPVDVAIYDVGGRLVRRLLSTPLAEAGEKRMRWDGTTRDGWPVASGTYFCRLEVGAEALNRKLLLIR
jgi:hypothetical protein